MTSLANPSMPNQGSPRGSSARRHNHGGGTAGGGSSCARGSSCTGVTGCARATSGTGVSGCPGISGSTSAPSCASIPGSTCPPSRTGATGCANPTCTTGRSGVSGCPGIPGCALRSSRACWKRKTSTQCKRRQYGDKLFRIFHDGFLYLANENYARHGEQSPRLDQFLAAMNGQRRQIRPSLRQGRICSRPALVTSGEHPVDALRMPMRLREPHGQVSTLSHIARRIAERAMGMLR